MRSIRRLPTTAHSYTRHVHAFASQTQRHAQPSNPTTAVHTPQAQFPTSDQRSAKPQVDPFGLLSTELKQLRNSMLTLMGSAHPGLTQIAEYYFLQPSKQLRPLLVLLFSHATNGLGQGWRQKLAAAEQEAMNNGLSNSLDAPLTRPDVLNDWNPNIPEHTSSFSTVFNLMPIPNPVPSSPSVSSPSLASVEKFEPQLAGVILPTQTRLAQIAEMIHVASLLHDDVIDTSPLRRGVPSGPANFGNKLSVLGGDFLLGRASAALSRLGENEVVELVASVIANLVEGEVMQVREVHAPETLLTDGPLLSSKDKHPPSDAVLLGGRVSQERWDIYMKKNYLKTASLMAKTIRGAVVLGGSKEGELWKEVAYAYGRNIGIAFQLIDDMLDFAVSDASFGKPSGGADLRLGLATAPTLYAWEEFEEMGPLIKRRFEGEGDVELARQIVTSSKGVARTKELAESYAAKAREVLGYLPDSDAKEALVALTEMVIKRKH